MLNGLNKQEIKMNIADVQHILSDEETRDFVNHHLKYDETFNCYKI